MKKTITLLFLAWSLTSMGQNEKREVDETLKKYAVLSMSAGTMFESLFAKTGIGYRVNDVYVSTSILATRSPSPKIWVSSIGYNLKAFQPFVSIGKHIINDQLKQSKESGWKLGYGMTYYPRFAPLFFTIERQGNKNMISLGIYGTIK